MLFQLGDLKVQCQGDDQFIAHNATVIGNVTLAEKVSVWFNVVIRDDAEKISIGSRSNIQDASVLHADPGFPLEIGEDVTVGHKAMLHGCTVGDGSLIGINAVVLNGAKIGKGCLIGANALVTEGSAIPDGSMVLGAPAKVKRMLSEDEQAALRLSASHYVENGQRFRKELKAEQ